MGLIDFIMILNAAAVQAAVPPGDSGWDNDEEWDNDEPWVNE